MWKIVIVGLGAIWFGTTLMYQKIDPSFPDADVFGQLWRGRLIMIAGGLTTLAGLWIIIRKDLSNLK